MNATALPLSAPSGQPSSAERRLLTLGVAGAHLAALWGLAQMDMVQTLVREQAPLVVDFLTISPPAAPPTPTEPTPTQPSRPAPAAAPRTPATPRPPRPVAAPVVAAASPAPALAPSFVAPEPSAAPAATAATAVTATHALPAPPAAPADPPAPPSPKPVAASALRYAVPPPIELPMASRRLGESGTVVLRVVFDTQGRARQVSVQRSSGFVRLDEQAVQAMRQARIAPFLDNGQAVEVLAQAPCVYELE